MDMREDEHIIVDFDEALQKTGAELFKELYRIYPMAEVEDYCKNGTWKNDLMKADLRLLEAHRREAGAPDVPDLEDIKFPTLPKPPGTTSVIAGLKPLTLASSATKIVATGGTTGSASVATATLDIRLMALFVAKWKLDPAKARDVFAKMNNLQRRHIISNFKPSAGAAGGDGIEALQELQLFIAKCQTEKDWDINCIANATSNATDDASAEKASSSSTAPATALGVLAKATLPKATLPKGGPTPTPLTLTSPLINVPKLRPSLSSVKPTGITSAMVQSMKRSLAPVTGKGANGLNWNSNKRPALASSMNLPQKGGLLAQPSLMSRSLPGKGFTPAAQPPGSLFNLLNGL